MTLSAYAGLIAVLGGALAAGACSSSSSTTGSIPPGIGISCGTTSSANDAATAKTALASASPGTCVVLSPGTYAGPFSVPAGASLVAQNGGRAVITGGTAQEPAVSLAEGSQLAGADIINSGGVGIAVRAGTALLADVTVSGAKNAALAILCKDGVTAGVKSCAAGTITINDVQLSASSLGLWVSGAHVSMKGGGSANHAGTGLTSAAGVVAQDGAKLELENVTVEKNQGVGVLIDGAATTASIKSVTVNENGERGIWAQRVAGTLDAPAVKIQDSQLTKNKIVGMGAVESRGIIIVGGRIADTISSPLVTNLDSTEQIGDGVGMFAGSGDLKLDNITVESNARAAGLFDGSEYGIIIVGGKVGAGESGLKFVVQNSSKADVQISDGDRSVPPKPLGVSAPKLMLPPVL